MKKDFTNGNIAISMLLFSLPIVAGELLQNLYNSFDALIVGNCVGYEALAAVNVCGNIATLLVNFFNGMSVGANVVVSKAYGSKDVQRLKTTVKVTFSFSTVLGIILSLAGIIFSNPLLKIAGVQPEYYLEAITYIRVYLAGLMFTVIYNNGAGILRAMGDSQTPFIILCVCCGTNIALDILFVDKLAKGIAGASFATIIAQGISAIAVYVAISKRICTSGIDFKCLNQQSKSTILAVSDIGTAAGIQGSLVALSNLFLMRYINMFDVHSVAGIGIAQKIDRFVILPSKAFGITMTTFVGQNLGANQQGRIKAGKNKCIFLAMLITMSLSMLIYFSAATLVRCFNDSPEVIEVGISMVKRIAPFYWILPIREVYIGLMRGYGNSRVPMILVLIGNIAIRQGYLAVSMAQKHILGNIYNCYPIAWICSSVLIIAYYIMIKNNLLSKAEER